jgi:hypothetical protein
MKEDEMDRACTIDGEKKNAYKILVIARKDHYEDLDVGGRTILK